jgi:LCP family protein required for cell wall assembly
MPAPDMRPPRTALPGRRVAEPPPPGGPRTGPGFWRRRWRRVLAIGIPVVFLLFVFWLYLGYRSFSDEVARANTRIDKRTKAALAPAGNILRSPQISLVMGSDSRGKSATSGARADSILLVRTDPSHHLISMLSIPRDLYVPIPGHGTNKINAAFAFGGPPLLIRTVNRLTDLKVNHVVLVDFTGFRDLIDQLGGITIVNPTKIVSSENFDGHGWQFGKGPIQLDGRRALAYARIRHTTNAADSDISRTERQQRVLQALMHELVKPSSLLHLPSIGAAVAKPLATDLSANELIGMGWIKFRAGRTLQCHLGGTPLVLGGQDVLESSEQNAAVVQMFLGDSAPQPAPKGQLYAPGCTVQ